MTKLSQSAPTSILLKASLEQSFTPGWGLELEVRPPRIQDHPDPPVLLRDEEHGHLLLRCGRPVQQPAGCKVLHELDVGSAVPTESHVHIGSWLQALLDHALVLSGISPLALYKTSKQIGDLRTP